MNTYALDAGALMLHRLYGGNIYIIHVRDDQQGDNANLAEENKQLYYEIGSDTVTKIYCGLCREYKDKLKYKKILASPGLLRFAKSRPGNDEEQKP